MPILGIIASQVTGHLAPLSSYDSIATVTVGSGGASSITFSSIPSTYTHLQIRGIGKFDPTVTDQSNILYNINSDTGTNYTLHSLRGNGTAASAYGAASTPALYTNGIIPSSVSTRTNMFGVTVTDFLDYKNTNKYKTMRSLGGFDANGSGYLTLSSGVWMNTAAITSIVLTLDSGSWTQYSSFALYGVK